MSTDVTEEVELAVTELLVGRGRKYGAYNAHQLYGHLRAEPTATLPLRLTVARPGSAEMVSELLEQLGQAVSAGIEAVDVNGRRPAARADSVGTELQVESAPSPSPSLRPGLASAPSGPPPEIDDF